MAAPIDRLGDDATVRRLDALLLRRPELAEAIAFYRRALPAQRVAASAVVHFRYDPQAAQRKLDAGIPLLVDEDLPFDPQTLVALFGMLCRIAEAADLANSDEVLHLPDDIIGGSGLGRAAAKIRQAAEQGGLDFRSLVRAVAANATTEVAEITDQYGIDTELSTLLIQNTLKPTLRAWAITLSSKVDLTGWGRGPCPVCGSKPTLSEMAGLDSPQFLRCGHCGARWPYPPNRCGFCGSSESDSDRYVFPDHEPDQDCIRTCLNCGCYLKVILTNGPLPADSVLTEDLATIHLDALAIQRGFIRPAPE